MRRALLVLAACGPPPPSQGPALVPAPRCVLPTPADLTGGCPVVGDCAQWTSADGSPLEHAELPIGDVICQPTAGEFLFGHCGGGEFHVDRDLQPLASVTDHVEAPDGVIATEVPGLSFAPRGAFENGGTPSREIDVTRGAESYRLFVAADAGDLTLPIAGTAPVAGDAPHPMLVIDNGEVVALHCVRTLADVEEVAIYDPEYVTVYEASTGKVIAAHTADDSVPDWLDTL